MSVAHFWYAAMSANKTIDDEVAFVDSFLLQKAI